MAERYESWKERKDAAKNEPGGRGPRRDGRNESFGHGSRRDRKNEGPSW